MRNRIDWQNCDVFPLRIAYFEMEDPQIRLIRRVAHGSRIIDYADGNVAGERSCRGDVIGCTIEHPEIRKRWSRK